MTQKRKRDRDDWDGMTPPFNDGLSEPKCKLTPEQAAIRYQVVKRTGTVLGFARLLPKPMGELLTRRSKVQAWVNGTHQPKEEALEKIAKALGIKIARLHAPHPQAFCVSGDWYAPRSKRVQRWLRQIMAMDPTLEAALKNGS